MSERRLSSTCLAGPAWSAADAQRRAIQDRAEVAARAVLAALDFLAEAGWSAEQLRVFVDGLLAMRADVPPREG